MLTFIIKAGPVIYPIILGSIVGFAIVIERLFVFNSMRLDTFKFVHEFFKELKAYNIKKALELCDRTRHPVAAVFKIGLERLGLPLGRLEKILEQVGNNQIQRMEKNLGMLSAIIAIEPLMGFLGTITGLIRAFMSWEQAGAEVTVSALAGGIYEAMITTAAGLSIAIPLYLCYNYFVSRIKVTANELTNYAIQLLEIIAEVNEGDDK